jgi:preprotein translocase subunit SecA
MLNQLLISPPATHVLRPENKERRSGIFSNVSMKLTGGLREVFHRLSSHMPDFVSKVNQYGRKLESLKDDELRQEADVIRQYLLLEGFRVEHVARSFALVRETAARTLSMRHFDTQLMGGLILLKGMVAEMETGEGKTLTATLPAVTAALGGIPVHVITVNDYLTERDAEWMGPIYRALGLNVGFIIHDMPPESRRAAYGCDVTYCTNKEIAFDYLRDWIVLEGRRNSLRLQAEYLYGNGARVHRLLLRGLYFAIVDEADSVLIDEARTPLIISKTSGGREERAFLEQAVSLARGLEQGTDYRIEKTSRKVELTKTGKHRIREMAVSMGPLWTGAVRREEMVVLALTAIHLFRCDEQYLVKDGKVQIVDEFTGRVMPDRSYEQGLHQLIEVKEGCEISHRPETVARISYQRFFRRYFHLAGMTGTAREVKGELWTVYNLLSVRVPTHRKMCRKPLPDQIFLTEEDKWRAVAERTQYMNKKKRPVLVGTRSVAASEKAGFFLEKLGLTYTILNAKQDKEEAEIISRAGEEESITIATNMAGRGTDIRLGPGVVDKDGLHVILTERHEAGRIDRQLAGRCGRLGDPGSYEAILSFEDPILEGGRGGFEGWVSRNFVRPGSPIWRWLVRRAILAAQRKIERLHAKIRKSLLREDERRGDMLSFSGLSE